MKEKKFVALLLGINVGGHRRIKMVDLKAAFEELGFTDVKTLLASGNVVFAAKEHDKEKLKQVIEKKLMKAFGFAVQVILRTEEEIQNIINSNPFRDIPVTKNTRLYVLFLGEKNTSDMTLPYLSPLKDFEILRIDDFEVYSVLTVTQGSRTVDSMKILGKEFGRYATMRNWNTVLRLLSK